MKYHIKLQQIHEAIQQPAPLNSSRVLIDRLWPRGIRKADLGDISWYRAVSLSATQFNHAYAKQLQTAESELEPLIDMARKTDLYLLTATHNPEQSYLTVLRDTITDALQQKPTKD